MPKNSQQGPHGVALVDKPAGMTSHDVVSRCRRIFGTRKVGHAGTLDPMATGVLVIGVGQCTRLLTYLVGADKTYTATIRLGVATVTDDAEGEPTTTAGVRALLGAGDAGPDGIAWARVHDALARLTGEIDQVPSAVSAIKQDGQRAYARVRAGEQVELPSRRVRVGRLEMLGHRALDVDAVPVLDLDVVTEVSSGTYVRALARDLGERLGTGGHLTALRRTVVTPFTLDDCTPLETLAEQPVLLAPSQAARAVFPVLELSAADAGKVGNGGRLSARGLPAGPHAAIVGSDDRLLALMEEREGAIRPLVVFPAV